MPLQRLLYRQLFLRGTYLASKNGKHTILEIGNFQLHEVSKSNRLACFRYTILTIEGD
jgi:hypothetical protein